MGGLEERFGGQRTLFIPYMTGGFPNLSKSESILRAMAEEGVKVMEVGIPFSDPIADGITIQEATSTALSSGATPRKILDMIGRITSSYDVSIVLMTYLNPVYRFGVDRFLEKMREKGASGIIIPDLPLEESHIIKLPAKKHDVSLILLAAPTTSDARLRRILEESMGFTYLVSLKGTTGERSQIPKTAYRIIRRAKSLAPSRRIAIGFGISSPQHAKDLAKQGADGIIVGSKIISSIRNDPENAESRIRDLVKSFLKVL